MRDACMRREPDIPCAGLYELSKQLEDVTQRRAIDAFDGANGLL
ncbi:hypothetical protein F8B43_5647 [Methylorubrum populi]|uniref:Uncharacterized protein n=1 Tax=Methylorubrum populi TaxID=223967 RepID=A0A833IZW5_9HYPH|nr:hypothetical protein F8B43_5647 [Methylorubrum populi]